MKQVKKLLAIILTIATLLGVFSCGTSVFAEEYNAHLEGEAYEEQLLTEVVESEGEKAEIIGEVTEKRDEYSKTYKRADGSYTSIVSGVPLHKYEDGQWNEIVDTFEVQEGEIVNSGASAYSLRSPSIELPDYDDTIIEDTLILKDSEDSNSQNTNYSNVTEAVIAHTSSYHGEVLVKFNLDILTFCQNPGVVVTDVNYECFGYVLGNNLIAKPVNDAWNSKTVTYSDVYPGNNQQAITYENKIIDYFTGVPSTDDISSTTVSINITDLFTQWLNGRANNGFVVMAEDENTTGYFLIAGNANRSMNSYITIDYVDTSGRNDAFEYLTQEIGRAGTASVNTLSRSLSISRSDLSMSGLRSPVNIAFNYDPASYTFSEFVAEIWALDDEVFEVPDFYGNNWLPSYSQWISYGGIESQIYFFSGEGAIVCFNEKEETITEDRVEVTKTVYEADESSPSGYSLEKVDPEGDYDFENIKIVTPDGESVCFNENGLVTEIREAEANSDGSYDKVTISYAENELFKIEYITDGIGRMYDFVYATDTELLSEIKCLAADGTPIKAGTTNTDLKVTYEYDTNNNLIKVNYPDTEAVTYTYDTDGNITKVQNIDNYNIQYTYDTLGKVTNVAEYADTLSGNTITLTQLSNRQVKVVDDFNGTETYQFGRDGKLYYTFDDKGNYYKSNYAPTKDENVYSSNEWKISSQNLLKNGSFETASVLRNTRGKYWSAEFETTALPAQQVEENGEIIGYDSATFGEKVYLISSSGDCTEFVSQTVEIPTSGYYTFSAFVRSETAGQLTLKVTGINASNVVDTWDCVTIDTTTGWERYSVTYTPSKDFVAKEIKVSIGFENRSGTYYVDCAQIEKGLGTAEYNLVKNGLFAEETLYWSNATIENKTVNGNSVNAVKLTGGLPSYNDTAVEDHISATTQNVEINGKKGDTYSIGGWFQGSFNDKTTTSQLTNSAAQIKVTYSYTDTVTTTDETTNETTTTEQTITENFVLDFAPNNNDWQYATDTFALKGDTESVDVTVMAKNVPEDCYATGIEFTSDNDAFSFVEEEETTTSTENAESSENTTTEDTTTENTTPEECLCEDCEELDCSCRCTEACTCIQCNRRSDIETTSEDGKTITTSSFDGEKYMQSSITYSNDLNNVISETDENNISAGYAYNDSGSLTSFTDGAGKETTYQSNAMGYLTLAESNVSGLSDNAVKMAISYAYDGDLLTNVTEGNVQYTYEYDGWGQLKKVLVDGVTLVCYNYDENNNAYRTRIISIIFGSSENTGFTVKYTYDTNGNIVTVEKYRFVEDEKDSITYTYGYDNLGNLTSITDNGTGHYLAYTDDGIVIKAGQSGSVIYQTKDVSPESEIEENATTDGETENTAETNNDTPKLISVTQEIANGTSYNHKIYESKYSDATGKSTENEAVSVVTSADENNNFTYGKTIGTQTLSDWFGRNEAVTVMTKDPVDTATTDFASISSQYSYVTNNNVTTNLIASVTNTITGEDTNTVNYNYSYDSNGRITNISTVSSVQNFSGASQYVYDEAGQLIREITGSTIYEYAYDSKGNISSRKVYSGETLVSTDTFTYGSDTWEDRLTGYNNKTIAYDSIGNPTSYLGATLSWRGRELSGYSKGNKQISYSYDVDGMRYRKVVKENDSVKATYDYVYSDGTLILLTYTANGVSNTARFVYDSWGEPRGFMLNDNATYLYLKNAQGDITGIVDENGEILVRYTYNAWGAVDFVVPFGIDPITSTILATVSPFTYRGYCYDYDIGMYYLQSRYYDPEICRFINADSTDYLGATGTLLSYNLFAYCENDGVNFVDETGCAPANLEAYIKQQYKVKKTEWGNSKLKLKISKNKITITAYFNFTGNLKNKKLSRNKYKDIFLIGVMSYWYGDFNVFGYEVSLITYVGGKLNGITVKMKNKFGTSNVKRSPLGWKPTRVGTVTMYKGKTKNYSYSMFKYVSAHEFGHLLGVDDMPMGYNQVYGLSIYDNETQYVTNQDIEMVLKAFALGSFVKWIGGSYLGS